MRPGPRAGGTGQNDGWLIFPVTWSMLRTDLNGVAALATEALRWRLGRSKVTVTVPPVWERCRDA